MIFVDTSKDENAPLIYGERGPRAPMIHGRKGGDFAVSHVQSINLGDSLTGIAFTTENVDLVFINKWSN